MALFPLSFPFQSIEPDFWRRGINRMGGIVDAVWLVLLLHLLLWLPFVSFPGIPDGSAASASDISDESADESVAIQLIK
ncbi:MAG: hypothetical protein C4527_04160 [Candidatus Omnitrophota bacterium]|jgi:hypothetical protein|nr:MAG: hypothetical protein C4527_04160 [Candidatus Omnitrophota bacterium]